MIVKYSTCEEGLSTIGKLIAELTKKPTKLNMTLAKWIECSLIMLGHRLVYKVKVYGTPDHFHIAWLKPSGEIDYICSKVEADLKIINTLKDTRVYL